jgi:hypothetical protein
MVWGVVMGLAMAAFYSVIAIIIYGFGGEAPLEGYNSSLGETLLVYWVGGVLGGAILGALKPVARNIVGAIVVGIVVALPVSAMTMFAIDRNAPWPPIAIMAIIFGTIGGVAFGRSGPGDREFEELEETYDRYLAGELSQSEIDAFVKRHGPKTRDSHRREGD